MSQQYTYYPKGQRFPTNMSFTQLKLDPSAQFIMVDDASGKRWSLLLDDGTMTPAFRRVGSVQFTWKERHNFIYDWSHISLSMMAYAKNYLGNTPQQPGTVLTHPIPDTVIAPCGLEEVAKQFINSTKPIRNSMSNILNKFRSSLRPEPLKSFVKYGIKDEQGNLTPDGEDLLIDILANKFEAELIEATKVLAEEQQDKK